LLPSEPSFFALRGALALADKGMNSRELQEVVTPHKESWINKQVNLQTTQTARRHMRSSMIAFNMDVGRKRIFNEHHIGDLCRWGGARGSASRKTFHDIDEIRRLIAICHALTNFVFRQRHQG